jgi:hypothetical protein
VPFSTASVFGFLARAIDLTVVTLLFTILV